MKKMLFFFLLLAAGIDILSVSCVSNTKEQKQLDTKSPGKWEGFIIPINTGDIHFEGAKVFLDISAEDSTFRMIARSADTAESVSLSVKDTILVLSGDWSLTIPPDSIVLLCSYCRVVDTAQKILYDRPVEIERIPLPANIEKSEESLIIWEVSFADLSPLIPLLGLTIPEDAQSLLKLVIIQLQKTAQE